MLIYLRFFSPDNQIPGHIMKPDQVPIMPHTVTQTCLPQITIPTQTTNTTLGGTAFAAKEESEDIPPGQLAVQLMSVAVEGLTDEELSDSGGEGMYRERDEFVVRNEDIENLKVYAGNIWMENECLVTWIVFCFTVQNMKGRMGTNACIKPKLNIYFYQIYRCFIFL